MSTQTVPLLCACGHDQSRHKLNKAGCRALDCGCSRYEPDEEATTDRQKQVLATVAEVCEDQAARARRELAELAGDGEAATVEFPKVADPGELRRVKDERDSIRALALKLTDERDQALDELVRVRRQLTEARHDRDLNAAELVSARTEADLARNGSQPDALYAYDAWQCWGDGVGCGARYVHLTGDEQHCDRRLTPVTVTITRRTN